MLCELAGFVVLTLSYARGAGTLYAFAYSTMMFLSVVLRFGIIEEVFKDLFRESPLLKVVARRSLLCVTGLLLTVSVLLAVYQPASISVTWLAGVVEINRGAAVVQCGLLLSLLLFSYFLPLSWHHSAFGIALGLAILTSVDLALFALRAEFTSLASTAFLNFLASGTYLVCVSIWIWYLTGVQMRKLE
jgi:hypothetical protein